MLKDKVTIITGGSRGIGKGIALAFAEQGAKLVINYHKNDDAAHKTLDEIKKLNAEAIVVKGDVSDSAARKHLLDACMKQFGAINILVNNAAIVHFVEYLDYPEDDFDTLMKTNIKAPFFLCQHVAKQMIKQNTGGSIINISSISAFRTSFSTLASYEASKAALSMLSKSLAKALANYKIRVNTISPGPVKTDINQELWEGDPQGWSTLMAKVPLNRSGTPEEIAAAAAYLASDKSAFTTAADIVIDGGWTSYFPV